MKDGISMWLLMSASPWKQRPPQGDIMACPGAEVQGSTKPQSRAPENKF